MQIPLLYKNSILCSRGWWMVANGAVYINTNVWPDSVRLHQHGEQIPLYRLFRPEYPQLRASSNMDMVINDDGGNDGTLTRKLIWDAEHPHLAQ